jgi:hypothetical protein
MNTYTRAIINDGMVFIFAVLGMTGKTTITPFTEAFVLRRPKIPASVPLRDITT